MIYLCIECTFNDFAVGLTDGVSVWIDIITTPLQNMWRESGGIIPYLMSKEVISSLTKSLQQVTYKFPSASPNAICISAKNVGLGECLDRGMKFAERISTFLNIPIIHVDHIRAHFFSIFANHGEKIYVELKKTYLYVIISGKNTKYFIFRSHKLELISSTIDIAIGDYLDKIARFLNLDNALHMSTIAKRGMGQFTIPKKNIHFKEEKNRMNMSFSGIQTYVTNIIKSNLNKYDLSEICYEIFRFSFQIMIDHTHKLVAEYKIDAPIVVGGGVSANLICREMFNSHFKCIFPELKNSSDNSTMIGMAGFLDL